MKSARRFAFGAVGLVMSVSGAAYGEPGAWTCDSKDTPSADDKLVIKEALNGLSESGQNDQEKLTSAVARLREIATSKAGQCARARLLALLSRPDEIDIPSCSQKCDAGTRADIQRAKANHHVDEIPANSLVPPPGPDTKVPAEIVPPRHERSPEIPKTPVVERPESRELFGVFGGLDGALYREPGVAFLVGATLRPLASVYLDPGVLIAKYNWGPSLRVYYGMELLGIRVGPELGLLALFPHGERGQELAQDEKALIGVHAAGKLILGLKSPIQGFVGLGFQYFPTTSTNYVSLYMMASAGVRWGLL